MIILQQNQCFILQNVIILVLNFTFCHSRKSSEASHNVLIYFPLPRRGLDTKKNDTFASLALNHPCFAERTDNLLPKSFEPCSHASRREQILNNYFIRFRFVL